MYVSEKCKWNQELLQQGPRESLKQQSELLSSKCYGKWPFKSFKMCINVVPILVQGFWGFCLFKAVSAIYWVTYFFSTYWVHLYHQLHIDPWSWLWSCWAQCWTEAFCTIRSRLCVNYRSISHSLLFDTYSVVKSLHIIYVQLIIPRRKASERKVSTIYVAKNALYWR